MTIGIYKLEFPTLEEFPYVGQSSNIEERIKQHKYYLKTNRSNQWMQLAFEITGEYPKSTVLETVASIVDLNSREVYWINKLDSINNGLNITDKVDNLGRGENNFNAKYSNYLIEDIFLYSVANIELLSNKQIAQAFGVDASVVASIIAGINHSWLIEKYPVKYDLLVNRSIVRTNSAVKMGIIFPDVRSPTGEIYQITNLNKFAREFSIQPSSLSQLLNGKRKSANRWKLA